MAEAYDNENYDADESFHSGGNSPRDPTKGYNYPVRYTRPSVSDMGREALRATKFRARPREGPQLYRSRMTPQERDEFSSMENLAGPTQIPWNAVGQPRPHQLETLRRAGKLDGYDDEAERLKHHGYDDSNQLPDQSVGPLDGQLYYSAHWDLQDRLDRDEKVAREREEHLERSEARKQYYTEEVANQAGSEGSPYESKSHTKRLERRASRRESELYQREQNPEGSGQRSRSFRHGLKEMNRDFDQAKPHVPQTAVSGSSQRAEHGQRDPEKRRRSLAFTTSTGTRDQKRTHWG